MDPFEILEQELYNEGIVVSRDSLPKCLGFFTKQGDFTYLNVDGRLAGSKAVSVLYHEMGHYKEGLSFSSGKNENLADRWAAGRLIDFNLLVEALKNGYRNHYELSKFMGIDEEYLVRVLVLLSGIHGDYFEFDNYILCFNPLMVHDRMTGRIWPETT